jgi:hypothetical protein
VQQAKAGAAGIAGNVGMNTECQDGFHRLVEQQQDMLAPATGQANTVSITAQYATESTSSNTNPNLQHTVDLYCSLQLRHTNTDAKASMSRTTATAVPDLCLYPSTSFSIGNIGKGGAGAPRCTSSCCASTAL